MDNVVTSLPDFCVVGSWFISPVLSGLISVLVFLAIKILVLNQEKPLEPGLKLLPLFYAFTAAINLFSVFYKGSACEYRESCSILGYLFSHPNQPQMFLQINIFVSSAPLRSHSPLWSVHHNLWSGYYCWYSCQDCICSVVP